MASFLKCIQYKNHLTNILPLKHSNDVNIYLIYEHRRLYKYIADD